MSSRFHQKSISDLLKDAASRKIQLPSFQRTFVWSMKDQQELASSLLSDIPIGSLLFLEGDFDDFGSRDLGTNIQGVSSGIDSVDFLLDGQQRLSSLQSIVGDPFGVGKWDEVYQVTPWNLSNRWCLQIGSARDDDPFGIESLDFGGLKLDLEATSNRFIGYRINKGDFKNKPDSAPWYHPAKNASQPRQMRNLEIAKRAAEEGQVPLWELRACKGDADSAHLMALKLIARNQSDSLVAAVKAGQVSEALLESFRKVEPGIGSNANVDDLTRCVYALEARWQVEMKSLLESLVEQEIPYILLPKEDIARAIVVFEAMNTGGTKLTTFDLLTAKLAKTGEQENLSEQLITEISSSSLDVNKALASGIPATVPKKWKPLDSERKSAGRFGVDKDDLTSQFKSRFLQVLSLLVELSRGNEPTVEMLAEKAVLAISPPDLSSFHVAATEAILRAWQFLQFRCGVRSEGDLRNQLLLVPLAILLRDEKSMADHDRLNRLEYWYWTSVLTGTYRQRQKENVIEDTKWLLDWIEGQAKNPFDQRRQIVFADPGYSDEKYLVGESFESAVSTDVGDYLAQYILSQCPFDFQPRDNPKRLTAWDLKLHLHHIVPLGVATTVGESTRTIRGSKDPSHRRLNSPLNMALISDKANSLIGAMPPAQYFGEVSSGAQSSNFVDQMHKMKASYNDTDLEVLLRDRFQKIYVVATNELDVLSK